MNHFGIRQSVPFDLPFILKIERANAMAAHWREETYQKLWIDLEAGRVAFVAECEGEVLGFIVGREIAGEWELENVAVAIKAKRQGIGTALVERLLRTAVKARGCRMFLEVRASNTEACSVYEKLGFTRSGRRKGYYTDSAEDALLFEKKLDDLSMKMR